MFTRQYVMSLLEESLKCSPEESLEVFRKLRAACISRIHRDENSNGSDEINFLAHEVEAKLLLANGVLYALHLHSDD